MKKSLYAQYVFEREGVSTVETETYFFTYKIVGNEFCVFDMFIVEEMRSSIVAKEMMDLIEKMSDESEAKYIISNVIAGLPNTEKSLSLQMRYGMKLLRCEGNKIILFKEIK